MYPKKAGGGLGDFVDAVGLGNRLPRVLKESEDRQVRASAIEALGRIGPDAKDAVTDLREHMKGNDALLRKLAADALTSIESMP